MFLIFCAARVFILPGSFKNWSGFSSSSLDLFLIPFLIDSTWFMAAKLSGFKDKIIVGFRPILDSVDTLDVVSQNSGGPKETFVAQGLRSFGFKNSGNLS